MSEIPKEAREIYLNDKGEPIAWCPKDSLGLVDIQRAQFYRLNEKRLHELSRRAQEKSWQTEEIQCVVCIDVDDPVWAPLVDLLMPGHDWDAYRRRGETPVARGVVPLAPIRESVDMVYPASSDAFSSNRVNVVMFACGGASVFHHDSLERAKKP